MRSFVDGWVEFETKKEAKHVALLLNGHAVGAQPSLTQQILCARPVRHGAPNSGRSACLLTRGACASLFVTNVRRAGKEDEPVLQVPPPPPPFHTPAPSLSTRDASTPRQTLRPDVRARLSLSVHGARCWCWCGQG